MAKAPTFREIPNYTPMTTSSNNTRLATRNLMSLSTTQTKETVISGYTYLGYNLNIAGQIRQVAVPHNLGFVPKCKVWFRDGTTAFQVDNTTDTDSGVYPLPYENVDATPAISSSRYFYADKTYLYVIHKQIVAGGAGSFTDFYHFEIDTNDDFYNNLYVGTQSTL